ncbi:phosphoribosylformylglycinamidine synthase subunit PurQ [Bartonella sp. DGB1]|uniref:phosphoribosylformylglycinamidine synthase subunit PurQ n=1 Tax=Bartonella sp. DGB1 TaxID=3239807 RepID=UPI0035235716
MKTAIVIFPGLNRDRDMIYAIKKVSGQEPIKLWQTDTYIPSVDNIIIPGGFSFGDYLRCGAIAARSPLMREIIAKAKQGVRILGVCNGFQILVEAGLLPGALMRNKSLNFICRKAGIKVSNANTIFTRHYSDNQEIELPIAHHDGNYFANPDQLKRLEDENLIAFRYLSHDNPNGSINDIAGIINKQGNILGMMPHPENFIEAEHSGTDGLALFTSLLQE